MSASVSSSAFCAASAAISLISSSSVFGAVDLRLRDLARRVDGAGGEDAGFEDDVVLVGVAGSGNARGWWRVETIFVVFDSIGERSFDRGSSLYKAGMSIVRKRCILWMISKVTATVSSNDARFPNGPTKEKHKDNASG